MEAKEKMWKKLKEEKKTETVKANCFTTINQRISTYTRVYEEVGLVKDKKGGERKEKQIDYFWREKQH